MSKFVAKFRKDRDYNDDYEYSDKKKRSKKHDPSKRLARLDYERMIAGEDLYFERTPRRKHRHT